MVREAIGIDIGGTRVRAARVGADGAILARRSQATDRDPATVLRDCLALIAGLRGPGVEAVGIGVPGRVDAGARRVLSGGYVDLSALPFADRIAEATGLRVVIENDATMALVAERAFGAARGCADVVLLTVGTGIGGAATDRGRIVRGRSAAAELGHLVVAGDGPVCACGRRGCLETLASGTALGRHVAEAGVAAGTTAEDLLTRGGDPSADAALRAWAGGLRRGVQTVVAAFDPEVVLLGGGLGQAALAALGRLPPEPSAWFDVPVRAAMLGDDAGAVGAALAALGAGGGRRAVLVNGVPASGKSTVARSLSDALGWPLLTLDAIKQPFLDALPPSDRAFNRTLGLAAWDAMLALVAAAPEGTGLVLDAWFGLRPPEALAEGLARSGVNECVEVWCEAPPEVVGRRYAERVESRGPGHPGLDYVPELVELARRAAPTGVAPVVRVATEGVVDAGALAREALRAMEVTQRQDVT